MKIEKFKTKDFVLIGIITAIYTVVYFIFALLSATLLPIISHALMPAIVALLFGGTIIVFLIRQIPKFGVLTIFSFVFMLIFVLMGMGYLPWFLSTMIAALLSDVISATSQYKNKLKNAFGYGIMQLGLTAGALIPVWFSMETHRQRLAKHGVESARVEDHAQMFAGYMGGVILLASFVGGFIGVYIGYKILEKHFKAKGNYFE